MADSNTSNVTAQVRRYLSTRPALRQCLADDLINYSALARKICRDAKLDAFDATLKACRRYQARLALDHSSQENVLDLLAKSRVRVKTKIVVITISKPRTLQRLSELQQEIRSQRGDFNLIEGEEVMTLITNRRFVPLAKRLFRGRILRLSEDLVQVSLVLDPQVEMIPGVVALVYGLLYQNGINVREEMSCWSDIMFVIEERDLPTAVACLNLS